MSTEAITATHGAVDAARAIVPRLAASTARSEAARKLDSDAVAAMREAGLPRLMKPAGIGGLERPLRDQILSCAETAHGCPAASWVQMVCGAHDFVLGGFADACLEEVYEAGPDTLIAGTLAPQGTVTRADGGWILDGRWQFCSGVDHSPWLMFGARQEDADTDPEPWRAVHLMVPKAEIEVDDTWHVLGMRGTGSKDVVAHEVFVPRHRSMPTGPLFTGCSEHARSALYHLPVMSALSTMLAGSTLGIAERGFESYVERTSARHDIYIGSAKAGQGGLQRRVAEARMELDGARRLLVSLCDRFDEYMAIDEPPVPIAVRIEWRRDAAYVVELCRRAIDRVFAAAGAHAVYDGSPMQTVHRDLHTVSHHAIVDFDSVTELAGKSMLGVDIGSGHAVI